MCDAEHAGCEGLTAGCRIPNEAWAVPAGELRREALAPVLERLALYVVNVSGETPQVTRADRLAAEPTRVAIKPSFCARQMVPL